MTSDAGFFGFFFLSESASSTWERRRCWRSGRVGPHHRCLLPSHSLSFITSLILLSSCGRRRFPSSPLPETPPCGSRSDYRGTLEQGPGSLLTLCCLSLNARVFICAFKASCVFVKKKKNTDGIKTKFPLVASIKFVFFFFGGLVYAFFSPFFIFAALWNHGTTECTLNAAECTVFTVNAIYGMSTSNPAQSPQREGDAIQPSPAHFLRSP